MTTLLSSLDNVLLMAPGPSPVADNVYAAMTKPVLGHMDAHFSKVLEALKEQLQAAFRTKNAMTFTISGTGSAGMETCFVNLVEPGDHVLVLQNGVFCGRMTEVASRLGAQVDTLDFEWGTPVTVDKVAEQLNKKKYQLVAMVHAETSTGVNNPIEAVGKLVKAHGALYLVDTVAGLGGVEVAVDDWNIDACYTGSQKCLSCPPGLAPATFSEAAMTKVRNRKTKVPNWYLDLLLLEKYWNGQPRVYHHTPAISTYYALHQALDNLLTEGLSAAIARHMDMHKYLVSELEKLGFSMSAEASGRAPQVNLVACPAGVNEAELRKRLRSEHHIEIAGGLGVLAGKVVRVGVMGEGARPEPIDRLLTAIKACM